MYLFNSCSINNEILPDIKEEQNEFFLQMQDRFNLAGITNMIDNYVLTDSDKEIIAAENISTKNLTVATTKIEYADGSIVYSFQQPDQSYTVVKIFDKKVVRKFFAVLKENKELLTFKVREATITRAYSFDKTTRELISDNNEMVTMAVASCEDMLGGLRPGETFDDCFARNWRNFYCGFVSCMTQATAPHLIAVSVALACTCRDADYW